MLLYNRQGWTTCTFIDTKLIICRLVAQRTTNLRLAPGETDRMSEVQRETKTNQVTELTSTIPGKRRYETRGSSFVVDEKYEILKPIGVGAYGVVMAAVDTTTGQKVAMKKITGVFDDLTDAKRVLREIRLMRALDHDNVSIALNC